eukprot:3542239-Rhodomonas_salina.2
MERGHVLGVSAVLRSGGARARVEGRARSQQLPHTAHRNVPAPWVHSVVPRRMYGCWLLAAGFGVRSQADRQRGQWPPSPRVVDVEDGNGHGGAGPLRAHGIDEPHQACHQQGVLPPACNRISLHPAP